MNQRTRAGIAAVLVLGLTAACGDGGSGSGSGKKLKMGIAVPNNSLNFAREMYQGATAAAQHAGNIDFKVVGPPNTDGPAEVQLFQNLVVTHRDGVVLFNLDPPIFTRPAAQAVGQGVPVVALDTAPTPGSKVDFFVGTDNYELGGLLAQAAVKKLGAGAKGTVVIGQTDLGVPVLDNRVKGIKETFAKLAPGIRTAGPFHTYSDPAQNYNAWIAQVHAHPDALAFLGVGDADSYDLAKIKQQEKGKYLTAGFDVDPKTLQAVKDGTNFAGIDPEHFLKGYISTAVLAQYVRDGKKLPKGWFKTPGQVVDSGNIDQVIAREKTPQAAYDTYKPQIDKLMSDIGANIRPLSEAR
ncbi:sugar ABC transporter substrate-binding protein [Actinomadura sp. DC4]|uniref:sugar ABC transporter substrate-binding protein n=1 Tax=Actinomadura sp. DC4 TaxID=3055069 RepID=UPI0025B12AC2|nr:sugar ABC transporter substrate-binding protein [Actinomadura sp. DC4]MDN3357366.1 sugar ABC transporter substrate-binding protein [Actinomadura sp. DC4]